MTLKLIPVGLGVTTAQYTWECPQCKRPVMEEVRDGKPADAAQEAEIAADPLCVHCREKNGLLCRINPKTPTPKNQ